jgi:hypothetical protein
MDAPPKEQTEKAERRLRFVLGPGNTGQDPNQVARIIRELAEDHAKQHRQVAPIEAHLRGVAETLDFHHLPPVEGDHEPEAK